MLASVALPYRLDVPAFNAAHGAAVRATGQSLRFPPNGAVPSRKLVEAAVAAAGPVLGDPVVVLRGAGRQQVTEAGTLVARYPAGFLLRSSTGRCFVNYVDLWAGHAVVSEPGDAARRVAAVLCLLRRRMPRPQRWGPAVMCRGGRHR